MQKQLHERFIVIKLNQIKTTLVTEPIEIYYYVILFTCNVKNIYSFMLSKRLDDCDKLYEVGPVRRSCST